jgi:hypothetical protein
VDLVKAAVVASTKIVDLVMAKDRVAKAAPAEDVPIVDRAINSRVRVKAGPSIVIAAAEDTVAINRAAKAVLRKLAKGASNNSVTANVLKDNNNVITAMDIRADNSVTIKTVKVPVPLIVRVALRAHKRKSVCRAKWSIKVWELKSAAFSNAFSAAKSPDVLSATLISGDLAFRQPPLGR